MGLQQKARQQTLSGNDAPAQHFFDVLAIFVKRRGTYAVQFTRASAGFSMFPASIAPSALPGRPWYVIRR